MYSWVRGPQRWIPVQPIGIFDPSFFLTKKTVKKYLQSLKWGLIPRNPSHGDEGHDLLDLVRVEVLQLDLVVMEEPPEEGMRGHPEPALVEVREGDDITIARLRHLFTAREEPLPCSRLRAEKPALDQTP
jgi:hypothetical protein